MNLSKANLAGLNSPQQQSEMKSILARAWPPLKPLPVFRYETAAYRATIDFDKLRGEWVCRKISFPSNKVQELRGELRGITLALPHEESEVLTDGPGESEHELEKDTNRRLQAIRDWKQSFENGARYFELRSYLSESQRAELDDSLRFSLTARQLQCNAKNIAYVFDALSSAGGRFATLIEFAKRIETRQETGAQTEEGVVPEAERSVRDKQSLESSPEVERALNNDPFVRDQEAAECCTDADKLPAVSIKDVFPEQNQVPLTERMVDTAPEPLQAVSYEMVNTGSASLVEDPHQEGCHSSAITGFAAEIQPDQSPTDRSGGSSSRVPVLEISAFHLAAFASLFLFVVIAFTVGLTVGRGPLGSRLREFPKSMLSLGANSPALPEQANHTAARISVPPVASSEKPAGANRLDEPTSSEGKPKGSIPCTEHLAETCSADANPTSTMEPQPPAKPALSPKATGPVNSAPRSPSPSTLTSTIVAMPQLPRRSAILVNLPRRGSQPFRVSFPEKTIAATPSLAMSSQLSVLVSPEPRPAGVHKPARLEAGEVVSFVWPHYPRPGDRYALTQVIRVRATIGPLGQVRDIKFLSGSTSLFPATMRAIRQWRYRPTLLDKRPVLAQQDLTIEFRPSPSSSQASARHATQKLVAVK